MYLRQPLLLLLLCLEGKSIENVRLGRLTEARSKVDTELMRRLNCESMCIAGSRAIVLHLKNKIIRRDLRAKTIEQRAEKNVYDFENLGVCNNCNSNC